MAVLNLKKILPNDSQIILTDKINFNFDEILIAGGGPPGDPGLTGDQGVPGTQGIQGFKGDDGKDGTVWRVGFGIPTTLPEDKEGDLYLDTSTNKIFEFDGTFWNLTAGLELKVAAGEFKEDTVNSPSTATLLQNASKNLVISSRDYNGLSENPNSTSFNSKFKIVNAPGVFIELGLDLGIAGEDESEHVTVEINADKDLIITNNSTAGKIQLFGSSDIIIANSTTITLNSLVTIGSSDGQYTGTIVNPTDLVNKEFVDAEITGITLTGNTFDAIRIGSSGTAESTEFMKIKTTSVVIDEDLSTGNTNRKLDVLGKVRMELMEGGLWDKANPTDGRFQFKGKQLETWGEFTQLVTNTNDISFNVTFPTNYGANNAPIVNVTFFPTIDRNEHWILKQMAVTTSGFSFKLFYGPKATGQTEALTFVDASFLTTYTLRIFWHAVGGRFAVPFTVSPGGSQGSLPTGGGGAPIAAAP